MMPSFKHYFDYWNIIFFIFSSILIMKSIVDILIGGIGFLGVIIPISISIVLLGIFLFRSFKIRKVFIQGLTVIGRVVSRRKTREESEIEIQYTVEGNTYYKYLTVFNYSLIKSGDALYIKLKVNKNNCDEFYVVD